ncbi:MAG: efflux RND transporter periplasmic adaptor subunit [Clostridium sp.]
MIKEGKKYKAISNIIYFLIIMFILTLLSRFSDSLTVPRVTTGKPQDGVINHEITGFGEIYESKSYNVNSLEGIKIESINVKPKDEVKAGDVLLTLNISNIEALLKEAENEISKLNLTYKRAVEDYNMALKKFDKNIELAKKEMDLSKENKEEMQSIYEEKKSSYEELLDSKEEGLLPYKRAIEDSQNIDTTDLTKKVEALKKLKDNEGNIKSEIDGYVIRVNAEVGSLTTQTSLIDLSDKNSENKIAFQISKDDSKLIEGTEKVDVKIDNGKTSITDLKIESIKVNSENPKMTDITISLPRGQGKIGEYGEIIIHGRSKNYDVIVPLEAIHQDSKAYYVLVIGKKNTILGVKQIASKVSVTISDKNGLKAALEDSILSPDDEIILTSNKSIGDGDRVRKGSN